MNRWLVSLLLPGLWIGPLSHADIAAVPTPTLRANLSLSALPSLKQVEVLGSAGDCRVVMRTEGTLSTAGKRLLQPDRYYVDLSPCRLSKGFALPEAREGGPVVRASQFSAEPPVVRVVVELPTALCDVRVSRQAAGIHVLRVNPRPAPAPRPAAKARVPASRARGTLMSRGALTVGARRLSLSALLNGQDGSDSGSSPLSSLPLELQDAARQALSRGGRYVWGGQTPDGFDCSGLMGYLYRAMGIRLPRRSADQFQRGQKVERDDLRPGDLVFFARRGRVFHVGLYLGDGHFFHAANPRRGVTVDALAGPFYGKLYAGARRFLGLHTADFARGTATTPEPWSDPEASEVGE